MNVRRVVRIGRTRVAALVAVGAAFATACEISPTTAPAIDERAVVHAVLNPTGAQQLIIVERTLTSASTNGTRNYEPIANARVVIYGSRNDSAVAAPATGGDPGRYRVQSITVTDGSFGNAAPNVLRLRPGERYRLRVETSLGVVTGETTIPTAGQVDQARRTINVDRDTLRMNATGVKNAAGYLLRLETRYNVEERYVSSLDPTLFLPLAQVKGNPDDQQWSFSFARDLMLPGLPQNFIVVALDSNYFRYYAAGSDPFGDDTRGNSLTGGVGMFGSVSPIVSKTVDLVADIDTPIEGTWLADRNSATLPSSMTLYASPFFPGTTTTSGTRMSGSSRLATGATRDAVGSVTGTSVDLRFIDATGSSAQVDAVGTLGGTTLTLTDSRTGERLTYSKR